MLYSGILPIMENKKLTPQFFFISLGAVVSLIISVSAFLNLTFETLNHALPDILTDSYQYGYATYSYDGIRSAIALLIIIFPIYLVCEYFRAKLSHSQQSHWDEVIKRWSVYLILFLASVTIITDLVILVRYFVSGEITLRFIYKVAIVSAVAKTVGWYYLRKLQLRDHGARWFAIGAGLAVLISIVWSFTVIGGPMSQRALRLDQRRLEDLQSIQWQVVSFWQQRERLPESLNDFRDPISSYMVPQDPEFQNGKVYEYKKTGQYSFELCATFAKPIPKGYVPGGNRGGVMMAPSVAYDTTSIRPVPGGVGENWDHEAGYTCFSRTIDPELYPPFPKEKR
jgi:hypothetical protein